MLFEHLKYWKEARTWARRLLCTGLAGLLFLSCIREPGLDPNSDGKGVADLHLSVALPGMQVRTRTADLEADTWYNVKNLWIGIYRLGDGDEGALIRAATYDAEALAGHPLTDHGKRGELEISELTCDPEQDVVIVGVANYEDANGIDLLHPEEGIRHLPVLLAAADTWEKYRAISAAVNLPSNITATQFADNLVMTGIYGTAAQQQNWTAEAACAVRLRWSSGHVAITDAQGQPLDGLLELRRLASYVEVNLIEGGSEKETIELHPTSWQLCNLPTAAYLYERPDMTSETAAATDAAAYYAATPNAADALLRVSSERSKAFVNSSVMTKVDFVESTSDRGKLFSFDFFQFENKHAGIADRISSYHDREREYKTAGEGLNTGIYRSLCPTEDAAYNNSASYLVITTNIFVTDKASGTVTSGNVAYTVHLGYCEGEDPAKSRDFNCRRNTHYIYNITINGVNSIVVEAKKEEEEPQPGAEGDLMQVMPDQVSELDAHYSVFNIQIPQAKLDNGTLCWRSTCPYRIEGNNDHKVVLMGGKEATATLKASQFYNWVQFMPTTGPNDVKSYPLGGKESAQLYYAGDLQACKGEPADGYYYFTAFVDEYVYDYAYDPNNTSTYMGEAYTTHDDYHQTWWQYVNEPNRTLSIWFVEDAENGNHHYDSKDRESSFTEEACVVISQQSIQTYYDVFNPTDTAIGIEHSDEYSEDGEVLHYDRRNAYFIAPGTTLENSVKNNYPDYWTYDTRHWMYQYVYGKKQWSAYLSNNLVNRSSEKTNGDCLYDDLGTTNPGYYVNSCLARNRDLNGNGIIDQDEIRWYMPQRSTFVRMMTGNDLLTTPLYNRAVLGDYDQYNKNNQPVTGLDQAKMRYALACGQQFYPYQGFAIGPIWTSANYPDPYPWQVRCIRDLGVTMKEENYSENSYQLDVAYEIDYKTNTVDIAHYDDKVNRPALSHIGAHRLMDPQSKLAHKFQYASEYCTLNEDGTGNISGYTTTEPGTLAIEQNNGTWFLFANNELNWEASVNANSICKHYKDPNLETDSRYPWRVPNINELAILYDARLVNSNDVNAAADPIMSSTFWGNIKWYMKVAPSGQNFVTASQDATNNRTRVRCVRDVPDIE